MKRIISSLAATLLIMAGSLYSPGAFAVWTANYITFTGATVRAYTITGAHSADTDIIAMATAAEFFNTDLSQYTSGYNYGSVLGGPVGGYLWLPLFLSSADFFHSLGHHVWFEDDGNSFDESTYAWAVY